VELGEEIRTKMAKIAFLPTRIGVISMLAVSFERWMDE
jgi:hypothetical protein